MPAKKQYSKLFVPSALGPFLIDFFMFCQVRRYRVHRTYGVYQQNLGFCKNFGSYRTTVSVEQKVCEKLDLIFLTIFQLFRKDLISAMKLPDNEPLEPDDYWTVQDTWKQEWEKGVQVKYTHSVQ